MARSEHLPIYKAAYDLCLYLQQVVRGFSRYHKYGLGRTRDRVRLRRIADLKGQVPTCSLPLRRCRSARKLAYAEVSES